MTWVTTAPTIGRWALVRRGETEQDAGTCPCGLCRRSWRRCCRVAGDRPVRVWRLAYDGYDPAEEGQREALCTLGNGFFATRGAAPESRADGVHNPGTYAAGCYNRLRDEIAGHVVENESMVTCRTG